MIMLNFSLKQLFFSHNLTFIKFNTHIDNQIIKIQILRINKIRNGNTKQLMISGCK